jgi:hypothetical protein
LKGFKLNMLVPTALLGLVPTALLGAATAFYPDYKNKKIKLTGN